MVGLYSYMEKKMRNHDLPGLAGLLEISIATVVTAVVISVVTGSVFHWLLMLAGLGAGWLGARAINR